VGADPWLSHKTTESACDAHCLQAAGIALATQVPYRVLRLAVAITGAEGPVR
jgi:hypothetical protein